MSNINCSPLPVIMADSASSPLQNHARLYMSFVLPRKKLILNRTSRAAKRKQERSYYMTRIFIYNKYLEARKWKELGRQIVMLYLSRATGLGDRKRSLCGIHKELVSCDAQLIKQSCRHTGDLPVHRSTTFRRTFCGSDNLWGQTADW